MELSSLVVVPRLSTLPQLKEAIAEIDRAFEVGTRAEGGMDVLRLHILTHTSGAGLLAHARAF
eukprot:4533814-Lingulodinium_polyedra.AAC.1